MAANLGIAAGSVVHVLAAGLGLSALLVAAPGLFDLIQSRLHCRDCFRLFSKPKLDSRQ
jgi:hypothetical protein